MKYQVYVFKEKGKGDLSQVEPGDLELLVDNTAEEAVPTETYIETDRNNAGALVQNSLLIPNALYKITGIQHNLYGEAFNIVGIFRAISVNQFEEQGTGIFYTPNYINYPVFTRDNEYLAEDRVIYGGRIWKAGQDAPNMTMPNAMDMNNNWIMIDTESAELADYLVAVDTIKYDFRHDWIYYRADDKGNEVEYTYKDFITLGVNKSPIGLFQWGRTTVHNNKVINAVFANINFEGEICRNNIITNHSRVLDVTLKFGGVFKYNRVEDEAAILGMRIEATSDVSYNLFRRGCYMSNVNFPAVFQFKNNEISCAIGETTLKPNSNVINTNFTFNMNIVSVDFTDSTHIYLTTVKTVYALSDLTPKLWYFNDSNAIVIADITD